jgi:hypothetical protein
MCLYVFKCDVPSMRSQGSLREHLEGNMLSTCLVMRKWISPHPGRIHPMFPGLHILEKGGAPGID